MRIKPCCGQEPEVTCHKTQSGALIGWIVECPVCKTGNSYPHDTKREAIQGFNAIMAKGEEWNRRADHEA